MLRRTTFRTKCLIAVTLVAVLILVALIVKWNSERVTSTLYVDHDVDAESFYAPDGVGTFTFGDLCIVGKGTAKVRGVRLDMIHGKAEVSDFRVYNSRGRIENAGTYWGPLSEMTWMRGGPTINESCPTKGWPLKALAMEVRILSGVRFATAGAWVDYTIDGVDKTEYVPYGVGFCTVSKSEREGECVDFDVDGS